MNTAQATTNHLGRHHVGFEFTVGTGGFGHSSEKYGAEYSAAIIHKEIDLSLNPFAKGVENKEAARTKLFLNDALINSELNDIFRVTKGGFKSLGVKVYEVIKESINKKGETVNTKIALLAEASFKGVKIEVYSEKEKKVYTYVNGGHVNNICNYLSRL